MTQHDLIPHLFRTEFSRITSVLCKSFGLDHMETAEDIVSETFMAALELWPYKGIPENPVAWLYVVAKNKTRNYLHRDQLFRNKILQALEHDSIDTFEIDLSEKNISDSMLQMLFAICNPVNSQEGQVALALRILCGFGVDEIATAFLIKKDTVNKRLHRARQKLREVKSVELPPAHEFNKRIDAVLTTLYLLFSEGYYSEDREELVQEELCREAMRLVRLLTEHESTSHPKVNALYALMCFQSSRLTARKNTSGAILLYDEQDTGNWDQVLIAQAAFYLQKSATGGSYSKYHLEAAIAYWHTIKEDSDSKWKNILMLYDKLLEIDDNPLTALNRIYALSKLEGNTKAIREAEKLNLENNPFYYSLLGTLYFNTDGTKAREHFHKAMRLAKTRTARELLSRKFNKLS